MLATLKIKIIHSITNSCCKTDIGTLINIINKIKTETEEPNSKTVTQQRATRPTSIISLVKT